MKNSKLSGLLFFIFGLGFLYYIIAAHVNNPQWYLPSSASEHGVVLDHVFDLTLLITGIVFFITQFLLFLFILMFHYKPGRKVNYYFQNHKLEIIWTVVPATVLTWLVIQGATAWSNIKEPAPDGTNTIEVMAEQFAWNFRYAGKDGKFGKIEAKRMSAATNPFGINYKDEASKDDVTVKEIVIPVNKNVLFNIHAKDVLHSFYLPHFRVKMDAVPGMQTSFWFKPTITSVDKKEEVKQATIGMKEVNQKIYGMVADETYKDGSGNVIVEKGALIKRAERDANGELVKSTDTVLRLIKADIKEVKAYSDFTYVLACAELCGLGHYKMRAPMRVVTEAEYQKWVSELTADYDYQ